MSDSDQTEVTDSEDDTSSSSYNSVESVVSVVSVQSTRSVQSVSKRKNAGELTFHCKRPSHIYRKKVQNNPLLHQVMKTLGPL